MCDIPQLAVMLCCGILVFHSSSNLSKYPDLAYFKEDSLCIYWSMLIFAQKSMKGIPRIVICDYLFYSLRLFMFVVLLEPYGTRDFLANNPTPYLYYIIEAVAFFIIFVICELLTTKVMHLPVDYSESRDYQAKRQASVSRKTIFAIENNKFIPSTELALKLSSYFGKTVNELFWL